MFSIALITLSLITLSTSQSPQTCSDAEVNSMSQCWRGYFQNYGFSATPTYVKYMEANVLHMNLQGASFGTQFCAWNIAKEHCVAPYTADCKDPQLRARILGVNDSAQANQFFTDEAINHWECGVGLNLTQANFYCHMTVLTLHISEIQACQATFGQEMGSGFSCDHATEFVNCVSNIYQKYCGAGGAQFACNYSEVMMEFNVPQCNASLPTC